MDPLADPSLSAMNDENISPWYAKGLRFKCTQCGECCTGSGFVWLTLKDIQKLANHLNITVEQFLEQYTYKTQGKITLREDPQTDDCIFLKNRKCTVYANRPKQCRTFPFWPQNLTSKYAWQACKERCEGIDNEEASLTPLHVIQDHLQ